MKNDFSYTLQRALSTPETACPAEVRSRCRQQLTRSRRTSCRELLRCQLKLLGWKVWAVEAAAAMTLYTLGLELDLWEAGSWTLRNAMFGLSALAMLTALMGLPFLQRASQYKMLELERATRAGVGRPLVLRFLLMLALETLLMAVLAVSVRAAVSLSLGQMACVLAVPFLTANNELLLLLRRVRPERLTPAAAVLFAVQLILLRLLQSPEAELPAGLPLAAGVLAVCMGWQCARLAACPEQAMDY